MEAMINMRYAGIIKNDLAGGEGVCVSLFTQGCPFHCDKCHNPPTWDPDGGELFTDATTKEILAAIGANGIKRNFNIMGGEPLIEQNRKELLHLIWNIRHDYPDIKIYLWTGYIYEELLAIDDDYITNILNNVDVLIDGPYIDELRDITLPLRGSSNQRIIKLKK